MYADDTTIHFNTEDFPKDITTEWDEVYVKCKKKCMTFNTCQKKLNSYKSQ